MLFIIGVGLQAGGQIVATFAQAGPALILAAVFVVAAPDPAGLCIRSKSAEVGAGVAHRRDHRRHDQCGRNEPGERRGEEHDTGAGLYRHLRICERDSYRGRYTDDVSVAPGAASA